MTYNNSPSTIRLEDDFRVVLNEARDFIKDNEESKCVIHHVKNNTLNEIEEEIRECKNVHIEDLRARLDDLVSMGLVDSFLRSHTYRLTKIGKRLSKEIQDPYSSN